MSLGQAVLGTAVLELVTEGSKLTAGLASAKKESEGWAKDAALAIAGVGVAAVGIIGSLAAMSVSVAHNAGEIAKLKRETGLTAEEASKFRVIGERMGLGVDDLSKS